MKSFPALTPAQRAKQLYQNGYCPSKPISEQPTKIKKTEHYIYNEDGHMIGYINLLNSETDLPLRIRFNNYWYKLDRKAKWDDR